MQKKTLSNLKFCFYWKIHNFNQIITKICHEYLILTKFRNDSVKIVDFLIKGHFWSSPHWADQVCMWKRSFKNVIKTLNLILINIFFCFSNSKPIVNKEVETVKSTIDTSASGKNYFEHISVAENNMRRKKMRAAARCVIHHDALFLRRRHFSALIELVFSPEQVLNKFKFPPSLYRIFLINL